MKPKLQHASPIRMAILTESISHFEVPLFRLCHEETRLDIKVFYVQNVEKWFYDAQYAGKINWGDDLLKGYPAQQVGQSSSLVKAALKWGAQVLLIYGYGWKGAARLITMNWLNRIPQIHRGTLNYMPDPRRPLRSRVTKPLRYQLLRMFQAHHYGGEYSKKVLSDACIDDAAMFFVPYSVDSPYFLAAAASDKNRVKARDIRTSLGWANDDHVLLYIAQHNWVKGPDIAMETFRDVALKDSKARFLIVGSGTMTEWMKGFAQQQMRPGSFHFEGFVPSTETVPYYLASDLVLCTSRYETWGRMINEAMLCGRPCVVNHHVAAAGGLVEAERTGFVLYEITSDKYAQAIRTYFSMPRDTQYAMQRLARAKAKKFGYEDNIYNVVNAAEYAITIAAKRRTGLKS